MDTALTEPTRPGERANPLDKRGYRLPEWVPPPPPTLFQAG